MLSFINHNRKLYTICIHDILLRISKIYGQKNTLKVEYRDKHFKFRDLIEVIGGYSEPFYPSPSLFTYTQHNIQQLNCLFSLFFLFSSIQMKFQINDSFEKCIFLRVFFCIWRVFRRSVNERSFTPSFNCFPSLSHTHTHKYNSLLLNLTRTRLAHQQPLKRFSNKTPHRFCSGQSVDHSFLTRQPET